MRFLELLTRSVQKYGLAVLILIKICNALLHLVLLLNGALSYYAAQLFLSLRTRTREIHLRSHQGFA